MPAPRDNRMQLLFTVEERAALAAAAERDGESESAWVRRAVRERLLRQEGQRLGILPSRRKRG